MAKKVIRLAVLISGKGTNLLAIIKAIDSGKLSADLALVVSNQASADGLRIAQNAGISTKIIQASNEQSREQYDQSLIQTLNQHKPDLIVLAGFMRILSASFIQRFEGNIINIHPSLLPAYKGLNTHQRVLDANERYHGATVHYVTENLDAGEAVIQSRIIVDPEEDLLSLQQRVHVEEHVILPRAIQWIAQQRNPN